MAQMLMESADQNNDGEQNLAQHVSCSAMLQGLSECFPLAQLGNIE